MGWNEYWHAPWMFLGPMMMLVFVIACVAVTSFVMRDKATHRGDATEARRARRRLLDA